ncbi:hypothetical protein [Serinicoccus sp. LYQ131]|uniref:hypothetical protein n=1 Tax=Serinicoccus sp. LYQ131 TaxID=3378797 RepID=UPI00385522C0
MSERPGDDEQPMLVLGEDRPDVEDTTAEQLREQQAELERQRAKHAQEVARQRARHAEEVARQREKSQERLEQEREEAERILARRQREIDDAERQLQRTERRLRQQAQRLGRAHEVPRVRPTGRRSAGKGGKGGKGTGRDTASSGARALLAGARAAADERVPRAVPVLVLLGLASAALVGGTAATSATPAAEEVSSVTGREEARELLYRSALALDREVLLALAGQDLPADGDGDLPSVTLIQEAADLHPDLADYYVERLEEHADVLLDGAGDTPVRAATAWQEARSMTSYAVPQSRVTEDVAALPSSGAGTVLLWGAAVLLALAALVLALGSSWVAAALTLLALVPAGLVLATDPRFDAAFAEQSERRTEAVDQADDVRTQVGRDLEVVVGLRALQSYELPSDRSPGYWEENDRLPPGTEELAAARSTLGQVLEEGGNEQVTEAALAVVDSGEEALAETEQRADEARTALLATAQDRSDTGMRWAAALAAVALPLVGLGGEWLRRRRRTT